MKTRLKQISLIFVLLFALFVVLDSVLLASFNASLPTQVELLDDEALNLILEPQIVSFNDLIEFINEEFDVDRIESVTLRVNQQPLVYEVNVVLNNQNHVLEVDAYRLVVLRRRIRNVFPEYNSRNDDDDDDADDADDDDDDDDDDNDDNDEDNDDD